MADLIYFLERNGFYPRREDVEAILRRLDHDANKMLEFNEFCEAVGPEPEAQRDEDEESKDAGQFERNNESPLRKSQEEIQESGSQQDSARMKTPSSQDKNKKKESPAQARPNQAPQTQGKSKDSESKTAQQPPKTD